MDGDGFVSEPVWKPGRAQAPVGDSPFRTCEFPNGAAWTEFYRTDSGYLLRFPALADFEVGADGIGVACIPAPGISSSTVEHLYVNQVLPLVFSKRGKMAFHASAVEISGGAVAFAGMAWRGKSTLAASFAVAGFHLLTDDGLFLETDSAGFMVRPGHPSMRLWADSREALMPESAARAPALEYTSKSCFLGGDDLPFCAEARPLRRVYFLGDGRAENPEIRRLRAGEAVKEWLNQSFLLDIEEKPRLSSHFHQVAALASQTIHYRLDYPRCYGELGRVREAILAHLEDERENS